MGRQNEIKIGSDANGNVMVSGDSNIIIVQQSKSPTNTPSETQAGGIGPSPYKDMSALFQEQGSRCSQVCSENINEIEFESLYGTMHPESKFYIKRQADTDCWSSLSQNQAVTISIFGAWQTGKSSLMQQMLYQAKKHKNIDSVFIDFQELPDQLLNDEESLLREFCLMIGDALDVPEAIDKYWGKKKYSSNLIKCKCYISEHIFLHFSKPFIVAIDEAQRILTSSCCSNFFGMLRTWHNYRARDKNFAKMSLILSSSTEPNLYIKNPHSSPFNVSEIIELKDFSLSEVESLNHLYNKPLNDSQINDLIELLGGHPFFTHFALRLLAAKKINFSSLISRATSDYCPFQPHLHRYWELLKENRELKQLLFQICKHRICPENDLYYNLKSSGLIKKQGNEVVMRNNLYIKYFGERLNV